MYQYYILLVLEMNGNSQAPEKSPYTTATEIAPAAVVTAIIARMSIPHTRVHGTIRLKTPTRSTIIVGRTRPKALEPLRIAIWEKSQPHVCKCESRWLTV